MGIGEEPDRPQLGRRLVEAETFVVAAQRRDMGVEARAGSTLFGTRRAARGHRAAEARSGEAEQPVARLPKASARSAFTSAAKRPRSKSVSAPSGAFAASHQRQASAGSASSAASVKIPRPSLVEKRPPS
jgi:hypothetical protein